MINKIIKEFENEFIAKDGGWKVGIPPKEILRFITTSLTSLHEEITKGINDMELGGLMYEYDDRIREETLTEVKQLLQETIKEINQTI